MSYPLEKILIEDHAGVLADPAMAFAADALTVDGADIVRNATGALGNTLGTLKSIKSVRRKSGRRALVCYEFESATLLGKIRVKGLDTKTVKLTERLWGHGFGEASEDRISVPQPAGAVPSWNMALQVKVSGKAVTELLPDAGVGRIVAACAAKLHRCPIEVRRSHSIGDELTILRERLALVAQARPELAPRLQRLTQSCEVVAGTMAATPPRLIHRDFHPAQVLVGAERAWLIDLDLCAMGDPALDIGNFTAHVAELALRTAGSGDAWRGFEEELVREYLRGTDGGDETRSRIAVFHALTLARHVWISTQFADRRPFTPAILDLAEQSVTSLARNQ